MTRRYAAGLAVTFLAAASALSCGLGRSLPEGAELLPADATFAVSVDVPAILESEIYKRYRDNETVFGRNRMNFYRFAEATGLDPSKDISRVIFMARAADEGIDDMSALAIGTFDGRKVHDFLKDSGLPSREVQGVDIFEFVVVGDRCLFCVAVMDASTAAFGNGETIEKMANVRAGAAPGLASEEGAGRLLRRLNRGAEAWGIVRAEDFRESLADLLSRASANNSAIAALGPIQKVSFSFDTADPMRVLVEMSAASDKDALLVADVLKGAESATRLALKETKPEFSVLMSDLVIEADTGIVRLAGSIPAKDVETITRLVGVPWLGGAQEPPTFP